MPSLKPTAFLATLEVLTRHEVEFVVVGGLAATLQGVPLVTFDVDVVHARSQPNLDRLMAALDELQATYRTDHRGLPPSREALATSGRSLFRTKLGVLDVLGTIEGGATFEALLPDALEVTVGDVQFHLVRLERLAALKRLGTRDKDQITLRAIEQTLIRRK